MSLISFAALLCLVAAFTGLALMTWRHRDWRFGALALPIALFVVLEFGFGITGGSEVIRMIVAAGGFITFAVIDRIIRDRTNLENSLRESEHKYRSIFESAEVGLTQVRLSDGKLLDANNQAAHLLGYKDRQDMMANFSAQRHWVDLSVRERSIEAGLSGKAIRDLEVEVRRLDGTHIWERVSLSFFVKEDYMVAVAIDVTESKRAVEALRQSEEKYRAIFDNAQAGLIRTRISDGRAIDANARMAELLGYDDAEELVEKFVARDCFVKTDDLRQIVKAATERGVLENVETEFYRKDGSILQARFYTKFIPGSGQIETVVVDISEQKQIEAELKGALDAAEYANRAKSEFLANMSHELRTPLNAILGFSQILERGIGGRINRTQEEYVHAVHESGEHLLSLINDILDLSKLEAGKAVIEDSNILLPLAVDQMILLVQPRAEEGKIDLKSDVSDNLPLLRADERMVKQMILNLLSNAVKFTPEGGSVNVSAKLVNDSSLSIAVSDTGIGMRTADIGKAISTFGQVDGDLDRRHEGTGLGLPLVKSLVELHGGTLVIESEQGKGTTGTLKFPHERIIETQWSQRKAAPERAEE